MKSLLIVFLALLALGGCSQKADDTPQGVLTNNQTKALEQAKALESTLQDSVDARDQTIEQDQ